MSVLHIATHPDNGALVYRSARDARYTHVCIGRFGGVLGWTGSGRNHPGARLVPCRLATDGEVRAHRAASRAATQARLPQRLERARDAVAWQLRVIDQARIALVRLTLGVQLGEKTWREPGIVNVAILNMWSEIERGNLERGQARLVRERARLARLEAEFERLQKRGAL
jgi:hypothetical protein